MTRRVIQELWNQHRSALQTFFRRRSSTSRDAADLTQEVYLRLLRAGDEREIANPEAYLFTVARNLLTEHAVIARRQAQDTALDRAFIASELVLESHLDQDVDDAAQLRALRAAIQDLKEPQKAALLMAFQHEMSYSQIAAKLGVHRSMVGKYVIQALNSCRKRLRQEGSI